MLDSRRRLFPIPAQLKHTILHATVKLRPFAADVAWSPSVSRRVCLLVTTTSFAVIGKPTKLSIGLRTRVGPKNPVLGWGPDPQGMEAILLASFGPLRSTWNILRKTFKFVR